MCELSAKLVAWLDRELPEDEHQAIARHIESCADCRNRVILYKEVSSAFAAYSDAASAKVLHQPKPLLLPVLAWGGAVVAACAAVLFFLSLSSLDTIRVYSPVPPAAPEVALTKTAPRPSSTPHQTTSIRHEQAPNVPQMATGPVIEIALPADEVFPPGIAPVGMDVIAHLHFAADGSVQELYLPAYGFHFVPAINERRSTN